MADLDDIKAFLKVAETGGFSRAAEQLQLSKSVMSRRIGRLEDELGVRLLTRSTKGVMLTDAGAALEARSRRALDDLDGALQDAGQRDGRLSGVLRVTAPISFGSAHLAGMLADFMAVHDRLHVDVSFNDRRVDILAEGFDVAVRMGALEDSSLIARRIAPLSVAIVASPAYLERAGRPSRPRELAAHQCIVNAAPNADLWRFKDGDRFASVRIKGRIRADNADAIREAAVAGLGIAGLPTFMLGDAIERGALVPLLTEFPIEDRGLYVLRPPGPAAGKTRAFIDAVAERFGPDPSWDRSWRGNLKVA
jgi:DNA-binding transcriptional LysR family regulator